MLLQISSHKDTHSKLHMNQLTTTLVLLMQE